MTRAGIRRLAIVAIVAPLLCHAELAGGADPQRGQQFQRAADLYRQGDYAQAASVFAELAAGGTGDPRLYFNLGVARLKTGQTGPAVLWFERAREAAPGDAVLRRRLESVRAMASGMPEEGPGPILRAIDGIRPHAATVQWLALTANMLFWGAWGIAKISRRGGIGAPASLLALTATVLLLAAAAGYLDAVRFRRAVVLEGTEARAGTFGGAAGLFRLSAGARVRVDRELGAFYRIRRADGRVGWVPSRRLGLIEWSRPHGRH